MFLLRIKVVFKKTTGGIFGALFGVDADSAVFCRIETRKKIVFFHG